MIRGRPYEPSGSASSGRSGDKMLTAQQPQVRQIPDLSRFVTARVVAPYDVLPALTQPQAAGSLVLHRIRPRSARPVVANN